MGIVQSFCKQLKCLSKNRFSPRNTNFKDLVLLMPGSVYWKDINGVYLGCNRNMINMVGLSSADEIIGKTDYEMPWKEVASQLIENDKIVIKSGDVCSFQETGQLTDKSIVTMITNKIPLRNKRGKIIGILGVSIDITAEKRAEQLEKKNALINEKAETIRLIGAAMAHELRTPLQAISTAAGGIKKYLPDFLETYQMAKNAKLEVPYIDPQTQQILERALSNIQSEARDAFNVVDMLLIKSNLSGIDTAKFDLCAMSACISQALRRYAFNPHEERLVHWDTTHDFVFKGSELLMIHVLFNLLKNAIYYVRAAGKGQIDIWCEKGEQINFLNFKDTGKGIPKTVLPHIFEQFFTRTRHGSGIGLAFCKTVMRSFDGDIQCQSEEDEYTLFILSFPSVSQP